MHHISRGARTLGRLGKDFWIVHYITEKRWINFQRAQELNHYQLSEKVDLELHILSHRMCFINIYLYKNHGTYPCKMASVFSARGKA